MARRTGGGKSVTLKVCQLCAVDFTLHHFLLPLIDGMAQAGWDVTAVCADGPAIPELRRAGYRIETVPIARSLNPLLHPRPFWQLVRLLRRHRFDVLHAHTPVAALLGRMAARVAGVPLVVYTAHGFYFHDNMPGWKRRIFVEMEKFGGRLTDLLFTQSAEDAATAAAEGIAPAERIFAIGNGVDVARFDPARIGPQRDLRRSLGIPDEAFVIGLIGRQVREKGVAEFLVAAQAVASRHPDAWFLLVGDRLESDHAASVETELKAATAVLGPRLVTTGLRRDIPELLVVMDMFCLPSWREGMPRTIIEAMMMGRPVLATDIRGSREEVVAEETGLLVPPRDAAALAAGMERFLDNHAWAAKLGVAGRRRALQLYDERRVVAFQVEKIREFAAKCGLPG